MKVKGVGYKDQENDESSEKKNLSLKEREGNIKKVWEGQGEGNGDNKDRTKGRG